MHPIYEIPPPIGYNPAPQGIAPPVGGVSGNQIVPPIGASSVGNVSQAPIGGVDACARIEPPTGSEMDVMIPSYPITPAVTPMGQHPATVITPALGSSPASIVPQAPITPSIGGPQHHHGYLATDAD
ncbi:hypothetical protein IQ266_03250 [filamentous cyanobacterium LEGE 11480]|uniref:Uncharacterized protein n=1 Tax=Romeriopsis navalis LEGE 11480 TaxID=2777977 RepID=A0A928Z2X2_9CYAN|nr:hypothetical protein [Romeriopsis navalis]MBE9028775.1 hypothetical protein [Romeriopsis navalis LEGE 11480]